MSLEQVGFEKSFFVFRSSVKVMNNNYKCYALMYMYYVLLLLR